MKASSSWFPITAALLLVVHASACGVLDDVTAAVEAQAQAYRQIEAQMAGPSSALARAYPQHHPQVTLHVQGGVRTFEVRLTTQGTSSVPDGSALSALADEAMTLALEAMPQRDTFDNAAFVFIAGRSVEAGPFQASTTSESRTARTMGGWEDRLALDEPDRPAPLTNRVALRI